MEGGETPKRCRAVVLLGTWGSRKITLEFSQGTEHQSRLGCTQPSRLNPGSPIATHKFSVLLLCHPWNSSWLAAHASRELSWLAGTCMVMSVGFSSSLLR